MKKTKEELNKDFSTKIAFLEQMIISAKKEPLESDMRYEYSFSIATTLRSMVCFDQNEKSLFIRCGLNKRILFPLIDSMAPLNIVPSYQLLYFIINGKQTFVSSLNSVVEDNLAPMYYLPFKLWLNEIVVDPKIPNVKPFTRFDVIKINADKNGAHVDSDIDQRIVELSKFDIYPIRVNGEENNRYVQAKSILSETVISIAMELVFSYRFIVQKTIDIIGPSNYVCYIQQYENGAKYLPFQKDIFINPYNSNNFFPCTIETINLSLYKIKYKDRVFSQTSIITRFNE